MKTIQIPGLDRGVSQLIMGSDYFNLRNTEKVHEMLDAYFEVGGNTIDTAHIYSGGESEQAIGRWMAERGNREQVVIFTKGAHHDSKGPRVTREAIDADLAVSLERLRTDYIDLYALHRDNPEVPVGPIVEALNRHIEKGTIRAVGGSNWTTRRLQEANEYAAAHGLTGFSFSSPNLSLAKANEPFWAGCVSADEETLDWHEANRFPLLSWSSQARGFFTGRFGPEDRTNADLVRVFYSDDNWERLRRAEQLGKDKGLSTIQIALAYVLNQPFPACALIGPQNTAELNSSVEGASVTLTPDEIRWLDLRDRG
ncbi:aldo/keto reductase [Paenibacillus sp. CC-CFT747]|nr:aldo/keto reductase [Paenibacillus sp. CC-CFT747]